MNDLKEAAEVLAKLAEVPLLLDQTKQRLRSTEHALSTFNAVAAQTIAVLSDITDHALEAALALERLHALQEKTNG